MRGDATLFTRDDEVDASWAICDPILDAWEAGAAPMHGYAAGTAGPAGVERAAERRRKWRPI